MDFNLSPKPRSRTIKLSDRAADRLRVNSGGFVEWAKGALHPFTFTLHGGLDGTEVHGDDIAVVIVAETAERVGGEGAESGRVDPAIYQQVFAHIVDDALKHDLAFRLKGLVRPVRPMSLSQVSFMHSLLNRDMDFVIGLGPTGTGKTHLAIAAALNQLAEEKVKHIVVTKPHVLMEGEVVTAETRQEVQYDEQFIAFEDAFHDLVGHDEFKRLCTTRRLEITPLGRMRGRTFNDSFIIVDEAQNMTVRKMRMALTRMGQDSRLVVSGDASQSDLPSGETSGLLHLLNLIKGSDLAKIHQFEGRQIIRNPIVARLESLYGDGDVEETFQAA